MGFVELEKKRIYLVPGKRLSRTILQMVLVIEVE